MKMSGRSLICSSSPVPLVMLIGAQLLHEDMVSHQLLNIEQENMGLSPGWAYMYISLLPSSLNQVQAKVAGPSLRLFHLY